MSTVETGIVKKFDAKRGFGFITRDNNEPDIFVHFSNIKKDGYKDLSVGQKVTFEVSSTPKGAAAINVIPE